MWAKLGVSVASCILRNPVLVIISEGAMHSYGGLKLGVQAVISVPAVQPCMVVLAFICCLLSGAMNSTAHQGGVGVQLLCCFWSGCWAPPGIRVAWRPLHVATVLQASAIRFVWLVCMAS
jgi:hypothetical protein